VVDCDTITQQKALIRATHRGRRQHLSAEVRKRYDQQRTAELIDQIRHQGYGVVGCYASVRDEPGTLGLLNYLLESKITVLLPWLVDSSVAATPCWATWEGEPLKAGLGGIPTPSVGQPNCDLLSRADVVILPGLAGTPSGIRLGTGGGWYDRALLDANPDAPRWLLLNSTEVVDDLPRDPWDQPVTTIVTESDWITCA